MIFKDLFTYATFKYYTYKCVLSLYRVTLLPTQKSVNYKNINPRTDYLYCIPYKKKKWGGTPSTNPSTPGVKTTPPHPKHQNININIKQGQKVVHKIVS